MIKKSEMLPTLIAASPSFQQKWDDFIEEWKDEAENLPLYLALSEFARHTISKLHDGDTDTLKEIFRTIENLHIEGDSYVKEAVSVGLLEDLQNTTLHHSTTPGQFEKYLGPESKKWWDKLNNFWEGKKPAD